VLLVQGPDLSEETVDFFRLLLVDADGRLVGQAQIKGGQRQQVRIYLPEKEKKNQD